MGNEAQQTLEILEKGTITVRGEFVWGSNYTFLTRVDYEGESLSAVYKPTRGERPLWDFPAASLAKREAAAYLVSEGLGWQLVPPTLYRKRGPLGAGSLQLFVDHNPEYHYFNFSDEDRQRLRPVVLFDLVVNNADRKGSHVLVDKNNHIWLIDHGICFHQDYKLRTVIWDFIDQPVPEDLCVQLEEFARKLESDQGEAGTWVTQLAKYLTGAEIAALHERAVSLVNRGVFPAPLPNHRPFPWPQI
jgi:uncharacterized repeat protein (TIGR03843 family)